MTFSRAEARLAKVTPRNWRRLLKKGGWALLLFYTFKGLLWLTVPYLLSQGLLGCNEQ